MFLGSEQEFQPQISGSYGVTVSNENCAITTDCVYFPVYTYLDSTIYACDYFLLDGIQIEESGTFSLTLPGDTILNLNIIIEELSAGFTQNGNMLEAYPDNADSYEWTDCDTGEMVGTGQTLELTQDGNFACSVSLGACTTDTECENVFYTGLDEAEATAETINLFPNPGTTFLRIEFPGKDLGEGYSVEIIDVDSKSVYSEKSDFNNTLSIDTCHWPAGLYLIRCSSNNRVFSMRWIKQ